MDERRKYRHKNNAEYKKYHRLIQTKIRQAKTIFIMNECAEIERYQRLHDDFNVHKKNKESSGIYKQKFINQLVDNKNQIITKIEEKNQIWKH